MENPATWDKLTLAIIDGTSNLTSDSTPEEEAECAIKAVLADSELSKEYVIPDVQALADIIRHARQLLDTGFCGRSIPGQISDAFRSPR